MLILGVDPGTRHLGWGVLRCEGTRLACVACGVVHTEVKAPLSNRLCEIDDAIITVVQTHEPDEAAVEAIFFGKNAQAASKLGHARGVVLLRLARAGLDIYEYPPARVKSAVAGTGRADKRQVGMMVKAMLGMKTLPSADATDALAVAVAHARIAQVDRALRAGVVSGR